MKAMSLLGSSHTMYENSIVPAHEELQLDGLSKKSQREVVFSMHKRLTVVCPHQNFGAMLDAILVDFQVALGVPVTRLHMFLLLRKKRWTHRSTNFNGRKSGREENNVQSEQNTHPIFSSMSPLFFTLSRNLREDHSSGIAPSMKAQE